MSDLTALLDAKIDEARDGLEKISGDLAVHREALLVCEADRDRTDTHLRVLMHLRALLTGEPAELAADDVRSADDVFGITIGGLTVAPPDNPTEEDLTRYAQTMRALYDHANHQTVLVTAALKSTADSEPLVFPGTAETPAISAPADPAGYAAMAEQTCIHCGTQIFDAGGGWRHMATAQRICDASRDDSPYAQPRDPFDVGPDPEPVDEPAAHLPAYQVAFDKLGRKRDVTPLELRAFDVVHLARLIAEDAAKILDAPPEDIEAEIGDNDELTGRVIRHGARGTRDVGHFTVEEVASNV